MTGGKHRLHHTWTADYRIRYFNVDGAFCQADHHEVIAHAQRRIEVGKVWTPGDE